VSAYVIRHDHDPRETRSMNLFEVPPCGLDQDQRNAFLLADEQAMTASALQDHFERVDPNHSPDSEFGNITTRHAEFTKFLPRDKVATPRGRSAGQAQAALGTRSVENSCDTTARFLRGSSSTGNQLGAGRARGHAGARSFNGHGHAAGANPPGEDRRERRAISGYLD